MPRKSLLEKLLHFYKFQWLFCLPGPRTQVSDTNSEPNNTTAWSQQANKRLALSQSENAFQYSQHLRKQVDMTFTKRLFLLLSESNNYSQLSTVSSNDTPTTNKRSIRSCHRAQMSSISDLMQWVSLNQHGIGLQNNGPKKSQQNICYLNSIVQCLANTAPFAQWLLYGANDDQCMYFFFSVNTANTIFFL